MVLATGLELAFLWEVWEIGWESLKVLPLDLEMESLSGFQMGLRWVMVLDFLMGSEMGPGKEFELGFPRAFARELLRESG